MIHLKGVNVILCKLHLKKTKEKEQPTGCRCLSDANMAAWILSVWPTWWAVERDPHPSFLVSTPWPHSPKFWPMYNPSSSNNDNSNTTNVYCELCVRYCWMQGVTTQMQGVTWVTAGNLCTGFRGIFSSSACTPYNNMGSPIGSAPIPFLHLSSLTLSLISLQHAGRVAR